MATSFNRSEIMRRAWQIFRETYNYPMVPFRSLGWKCFGWAVAEAWRRAREDARLRDMADAERADSIEGLRSNLMRLDYGFGSNTQTSLRRAQILGDIARLQNAAHAA